MSDILLAVEAGKEFLSLSSELVRLINDSETDDQHRESLFQILQKLRIEADKMSDTFQEELREMIQDLEENGTNVDQTFEELLSDLSWYNILTKRNLKSSRDKFYRLHRQLANFIDDVNAVLICSGTVQSANQAHLVGFQVKQQLDRFMLERPTIRETLEKLLDISLEISMHLHGGQMEVGA